jgi:hypothetical protein
VFGPSQSRSLRPWLGLAAAVHVLIWAVWRQQPSPATVAISQPAVTDALEVEILPPEDVPVPNDRETQPPAPAPEMTASPVSSLPREVEHAAAPTEAARVADATAPNESFAEPTLAPPPASSGVPSEPIAQTPAQSGAAAGPMGAGPTAAGPTAAPSAPPAVSPADRLAALGYGAPNAAALQPLLNVAPAAIAEERLNLHLAQAIVDGDRDRSLGIEGPVTNALHTGAMGVVWPKSLSKIAITIGRDGKLADFRIIETNRDASALKALGERVKKLLANQTVRVPSGRAMEFIYEVKSEVLLPSGRAPGLAIEAFGIPLKEGSDEKSSKISILTPHLEFKSQSLPDPERNGKITQTPPQLVYGIDVLGINADPVDIAANARQVVRTRLIQQRVL